MEYIVEAKSRRELREIARAFRKCLGLEKELYFPIVEVLDVLADDVGGNNEKGIRFLCRRF